jgi:hypothetical protein
MKKLTTQRIMAIFIGVVMLASIAEVALLRNTPNATVTPTLPDVVNRKLTLDEMRGVLTNGTVLIEYFYNETCTNCTTKAEMYKSFVTSDQFKGYALLSYGVLNETADWMLDLTGTQIDLTNITTTTQLENLFCDDSKVRSPNKPNVCLLKSI